MVTVVVPPSVNSLLVNNSEFDSLIYFINQEIYYEI
jgi:hypothetical protein